MFRLLFCLLFFLPVLGHANGPSSFEQAKQLARQHVYHDRNTQGDLYCGCTWEWTGRSGGRVDLQGCGYAVRAQPHRAQRIEWEHIVPASAFGRQRQCWQQGGRENCVATDPVFGRMEADLHNLSPVVGEVNADRSNYNIGMVASSSARYGACPFKVNFASRSAEPPDSAKGLVARVHFYMHDRYGLRMSAQQERILMAWDRAFPVSQWERERDRRIASIMGHSNPFVSGQRQWTVGYRPQPPQATVSATPASAAPIRGNKNSRIYHLQGACPGYDKIAPANRVAFPSEQAAQQAGFRRAGNCR